MTDAADNVIGFHHPGIVVPDLDAGIEFYTKLLGYELYSEASWDVDHDSFNRIVGLDGSAARFCMLKGLNSYIELFEFSAPPSTAQPGDLGANEPGIRHISFAVRDVQAALDHCIELGGSKINDVVSVPGGATATYCRDPFGNILELVTPGGRFPEPVQQ